MSKAVKAIKILCNETDDDEVDELFMFANGQRFWPNSDDGIVQMVAGTEHGINSPLYELDGGNVRFSLRDDESPLGSDSLGWVDISANESEGIHEGVFDPGDGYYVLTYKVIEF
jgi:hypothetical protein